MYVGGGEGGSWNKSSDAVCVVLELTLVSAQGSQVHVPVPSAECREVGSQPRPAELRCRHPLHSAPRQAILEGLGMGYKGRVTWLCPKQATAGGTGQSLYRERGWGRAFSSSFPAVTPPQGARQQAKPGNSAKPEDPTEGGYERVKSNLTNRIQRE